MDRNWRLVKEIIDGEQTMNFEHSNFEIGKYFRYSIVSDIKHLLFVLSRYKFVSKLVTYRKNLKVLELGCNEALGAVLLQQNTDMSEYFGVDFDEDAIEWNKKYLSSKFQFVSVDMFEKKEIRKDYFNLVLSLDVIEHIDRDKEDEYFQIISDNLSDDGIAIVGTPSENMTPYASEGSRVAHINLYNQQRLWDLANKYFKTVFIFNMNDEVVNTGFAPMACYIFAVCCGKR